MWEWGDGDLASCKAAATSGPKPPGKTSMSVGRRQSVAASRGSIKPLPPSVSSKQKLERWGWYRKGAECVRKRSDGPTVSIPILHRQGSEPKSVAGRRGLGTATNSFFLGQTGSQGILGARPTVSAWDVAGTTEWGAGRQRVNT